MTALLTDTNKANAKKKVLKILYQQGGPTQQYNGQQGGPTQQQQYNPSMYDQQSNKRGGGNLTILIFWFTLCDFGYYCTLYRQCL